MKQRRLAIIRRMWVLVLYLLASSAPHAQARAPTPAPTLRLLLPLYHYPGTSDTWARVAAAGNQIPITAIIDPDNGPGRVPPDQVYVQGITQLHANGVHVLGYVTSSYAVRPLADVKHDVDLYAQYFQVDGIFVDETTSSAANQPYYADLANYIQMQRKLPTVILNPGTPPAHSYFDIAAVATITIFEGDPNNWDMLAMPTCHGGVSPDRRAALIYGVASTTHMLQEIDQAVARNIRYLYVTDRTFAQGPWLDLATYWDELVAAIAQKNTQPPPYPTDQCTFLPAIRGSS